ncbi:MAG: hypothetical protein AAF800_02290 [Planctomycetota bacterium]
MTATQRTIGRARRRLTGHAALRGLGWAWLVVAALVAIAASTLHYLGLAAPWWAYAAAAGAALLVTGLVAWACRPDAEQVAVLIDKRLELKDRLGTSLYAAKLDDSELTRQVIDDAEQAAGTAAVGRAFPVRPTKVWVATLTVAAIAAVLAFDPLGLQLMAAERAEAKRLAAQQAEELEEALAQAQAEAERLAEESGDAEQNNADPDAMDPAELSDRLEAMLTQRDLSNPEDQREAAAEISDLQERFEQSVEQQRAEVEALQNAMSQLDAGETGPADDFADALRRGDFAEAQQQLAELAAAMQDGDLSESQQDQLAQQMQQLSDQLDALAEQQQQLAEQAERAAQQAMDDAGLSEEQQQQLAEGGYDPEAVRQAMQQAMEQMQGMSRQEAQQMAEQLQQQMQEAMQESQNGENAGDAAEQLARQMQQMSRAMQEQGMDNQQLSEAMQQMQQQLGECADQQGDLQNMQNANQRMQEAMQRLAGNGQQPGQSGGGTGVGPGEGDGSGGNPLGEERPALGTARHASGDIQDGSGGRVISSWTRDGQMAAGEAQTTFNEAVTEARAEAERAVTEDRTPRRYHRAIKDYFGNLPEEPAE